MRILFVLLVATATACEPPGYGKGGSVDAEIDGAASDGSIVTTDGGTDAAATCEHMFRLDGHGTAQSVWLTGDFVAWAGDPQAGAIAMTLGVDGGWTVTYSFHAGQAQYKFIVDGSQWIADPTNPDQIDDGFGGKNSLYTCSP